MRLKCNITGCVRPTKKLHKGRCLTHHTHWLRYGNLILQRTDLLPTKDRILFRIKRAKSCWVWEGSTDSGGYGTININGKTRGAHRVSYEAFVGEVPKGLELDHLCRNHACVNPKHLDPVTHKENSLRGIGPIPRNARKKRCKRGHLFTKKNTRYFQQSKNGVGRSCRKCARLRGSKEG